jgi:uncharacterized protein with HEPN domain
LPSLDPGGRLDDILRSIERIEAYVAKAGGVERLLATEDELHDGVERRLLIISEAAVKLGEFAEQREPDIPWRDIRGIGNALRHNYDGVNDQIIRAILIARLGPLADACRRMKAVLRAE